MKRQTFAVVGLGRFGYAVASTLLQLGQDVIGVDNDPERVRQMGELTHSAMELDATDIRALRQAGVGEADMAVVSIGENIEASLMAVMQVKDLGVPKIVAKAVTPLHGRILEKLGVTRVIFPEREMAERTARSLVIPNALDYIALSADYSIIDVETPPSFVGRTLRDIELRPRYGLMLLAIKRKADGRQTTLVSLGQEVIGLDDNEDRVREIGELTANALQIDATDIRALRQAGVHEADVAVISIGENIEASLLVVMQVKDLGVPEIIAKAVTPVHGRILEKLGVTRVIFPEREMAERTARSLVIPNALDYITLSSDFSIVEVTVPASFIGQTLRSIELRAKYGLTLVAIKRRVAGKEETLVSPSADQVLLQGDVIALLGENEMLARLETIH